MEKEYECCICHEPIEKNKRLVYQEYDDCGAYKRFRNIKNYDFCNKCFKSFRVWILKNETNDKLKLGVEIDLNKER